MAKKFRKIEINPFELDFQDSFLNKKIVAIFFLMIILTSGIFLLSKNISDPFIRFNEDNNALYGLAAINWLKFGLFNLKFGMAPYWLENLDEKINYYTHHPGFFILPTLFLYKLLGISEFTTRLSPLIFSVFSVILFYFLIWEVYKNHFLSFLSSFIFATLPAITFYGKMLDHEIFVLFFILLSLYFFLKFKNTTKNSFLYLFFFSLFLGNFSGWHFYFFPFIVWLLIFFEKEFPKRKWLLISIPLITIFSFLLNISHVFILGGKEAILDLKKAFFERTSAVPLNFWLKRIWFLLKLDFTFPVVLLGIFWILVFLPKIFQKKLEFVFLFFPLFVTIVFRQWITHPYGPFYYVAFFALAGGQILYFFYNWLKRNLKNQQVALIIVFFLLIGQFYSGVKALGFFDKNLICDKESISFLKEIKEKQNPKEISIGKNQTGIGYEAIFTFYLKTKVSPPEENPPFAIIFHPQLGNFYNQEAAKFLKNGYQPIDCKGIICLLKR